MPEPSNQTTPDVQLAQSLPDRPGAGGQPGKWRELFDELRTVFAGRSPFLDAVLPPIVYLILNGLFGFQAAMWGSLALAVVIAGVRLYLKQSLLYALAGVGSVVAAIALVWLFGRSESYFLPELASGLMMVLLALTSLLIRRPMVAWTSYLARRWPLEWYWHPRIRPAYSETTFAWMLFFAVRLLLQYLLFKDEAVDMLAVATFISGWPATLGLLVITYIYGIWRLKQLGGPGVDEFRSMTPPPWQGQQRGF